MYTVTTECIWHMWFAAHDVKRTLFAQSIRMHSREFADNWSYFIHVLVMSHSGVYVSSFQKTNNNSICHQRFIYRISIHSFVSQVFASETMGTFLCSDWRLRYACKILFWEIVVHAFAGTFEHPLSQFWWEAVNHWCANGILENNLLFLFRCSLSHNKA